MKKLASAIDPLWYKDAIIYELHVRAFADSNNDGIGDFPGLVSRLDYLQDLGITCIWLLPFFPSPLRDDGYDIANYVDVNPSYGTLSDFKTFLHEAHQRNIQVMIELVINHTSDQHPWFKAARLAPPGSPQREMYVWSDTDQRYKDARIIFTDTEKSNWTWDETAKAYYWHRFFSHQPDLNYDSPLVMEEVLKAMRFWLDMGVDALRMDAIPYLCERDNTSCENLPETHAIIRKIRAAIDAEYANRLILAEANQWPADVRPYFGDGDECHMAFHFPLMPRIYMALRQEDRLPITDIMAQTPSIPDNCQWGLFLRNHDELTLEMVTDDERDYMYFAYSADPRMRVNVGIRRRLAPLVDNNPRRIELLNSLLFSFPGTPIIYYGDEIGMGDNIYLGDRNGVRTPMQWTSDRNAGFSRCDPARLYFPVIMDPVYGYQVVNVEAQLSDQSSLLHWTRNMIALRKLFQVFGRGTLRFLNPANRKVLAYLRDLERPDGSHETILCVANLSRFAQPVSLDLSEFEGMEPVEMLGYVPFPTITAASYSLSLAPYSFLWLELQPAPAEPELRSDLRPEEIQAPDKSPEEALTLSLRDAGWSAWLGGGGRSLLESTLPAWLKEQRWFGSKSREMRGVRLLEWAELKIDSSNAGTSQATVTGTHETIPPILLFVEVDYAEGSCDVYQIPIAASTGDEAKSIAAEQSARIITSVEFGGTKLIVHDALILDDARERLLNLIAQNAIVPLEIAERAFEHGNGADKAIGESHDRIEAPSDAAHGAEHARAHENFRDDDAAIAAATPPHPLSGVAPVAPLPIDVQPGEAAAAPRSISPAPQSGAQRLQPRESPSAGDPEVKKGVLEAHASSAFPQGQKPAPSRLGSAEQSNTSILYGKQFILKLFRRLQPGENPDVEIGRFLTEVAHSPLVAPYFGEMAITPASGARTTTALLQGLVENDGDGWAWFLAQIESFLSQLPKEQAPRLVPARWKAEHSAVTAMRSHAETAIDAAALLGQRTAEMHLALSTPTDDPAFRAEPLRGEDMLNSLSHIEAQMSSALKALKVKFPTLDEETAEKAIQLFSRKQELLTRAHAVSSMALAGQRIRIHGDYHLGQILRTPARGGTAGDFVILDFEGEPARPLEERRRKQAPLKDVAGMLRSFSYAIATGLARYQSQSLNTAPGVGAQDAAGWASAWQNAVISAFLESYQTTIRQLPGLLPADNEADMMMGVFLLEKALYELQYELDNRPDWIRIPLSGILAV